MNPSEKPLSPRALTNIDVEYSVGGQTSHTKGNLLGVGALLLLTPRRLSDETEVELRFRPTTESPLMFARGVVSRQVPGEGLGVRLTELAEEHRRHILELLYPPGIERRASRRVSLVTQIRTTVGGKMLVGYSKNISSGGIFVETEEPPAKGTELKLRFKLGEAGEILEVRAVVAYSMSGEGMGLRFVDLPEKTHKQLEAFVNEQEA